MEGHCTISHTLIAISLAAEAFGTASHQRKIRAVLGTSRKGVVQLSCI